LKYEHSFEKNNKRYKMTTQNFLVEISTEELLQKALKTSASVFADNVEVEELNQEKGLPLTKSNGLSHFVI
jgi:glycyl-tRNA synthetase beta subunit